MDSRCPHTWRLTRSSIRNDSSSLVTAFHRDATMPVMGEELWPALPNEAWKDTYATLHRWSQMVGKVALATAPPINHGWGITFQVTPRGLATRALPHAGRSFAMEFDFIDHQLAIWTSDGDRRALRLEPKSVADFYHEFRTT